MMSRPDSFKRLLVHIFASSLLVLAFASCACTDNRKPEVKESENRGQNDEIALIEEEETPVGRIDEAVAMVKPIGDNDISGKVIFVRIPEGIKIIADIKGLKPGKHGFHAHEHGDCSGKDGMAAGGHFNPTNSKHGGPDSPERHVGDFGNLEADASGHAVYERVDKLITFEGTHSILGKSIIIHADPDDFTTQPTGASGPRIACGIIEAVKG